MKTFIKISVYLIAFILSNFIVLWYGKIGLIFTALFLIPFDFVMRCLFHEKWKGIELILKLGALVFSASLITFIINSEAKNIAIGSACAFLSAQIVAGIFYQLVIKKSYFIKVNGSDFFGIITDSLVFQIVAFNVIDYHITGSQTLLKVIGGFLWYFIIFVQFKLHLKWKN